MIIPRVLGFRIFRKLARKKNKQGKEKASENNVHNVFYRDLVLLTRASTGVVWTLNYHLSSLHYTSSQFAPDILSYTFATNRLWNLLSSDGTVSPPDLLRGWFNNINPPCYCQFLWPTAAFTQIQPLSANHRLQQRLRSDKWDTEHRWGTLTFLRILLSSTYRRNLFVIYDTLTHYLSLFTSVIARFLINPPFISLPLHPYRSINPTPLNIPPTPTLYLSYVSLYSFLYPLSVPTSRSFCLPQLRPSGAALHSGESRICATINGT